MELEFSAEDQLVIQSVREFAARHLSKDHSDSQPDLPLRIRNEITELGLWGMCVDNANGGLGFDSTTGVAVVATLSSYSGSVGLVVGQHALVCGGLARLRDMHAALTPIASALASGAVLYCHVHVTNPIHGAKSTPFGSVKLSGTTPLVAGATFADEMLVTFPGGAAVLSVETPGVTVQPRQTLGLCAAGWANIVFDDVVIPVESCCFDEQFTHMARGLHLLVDAAVAVGIAQAALQVGVAYAAERRQFDKPIADFQAIQWKIADSAVELAAARHLLYRAAAESAGDLGLSYAAMAARYARSVASTATGHGFQIHGGYGYTTEYVIERLFRDAHYLEGSAGPEPSEILPVVSAVYGRSRNC